MATRVWNEKQPGVSDVVVQPRKKKTWASPTSFGGWKKPLKTRRVSSNNPQIAFKPAIKQPLVVRECTHSWYVLFSLQQCTWANVANGSPLVTTPVFMLVFVRRNWGWRIPTNSTRKYCDVRYRRPSGVGLSSLDVEHETHGPNEASSSKVDCVTKYPCA